MKKNNDKQYINKLLIVIIIILIIIIILLHFRLLSGNKNSKIQNEKVTIIEITCDVECECQENSDDGDQTEKPEDSSSEINKKINIKVLDDERVWADQVPLNIFSDSTYVVNGKIAPESTGRYKFVVNNTSSYKIKYDISFIEANESKINIKYKLKKNDKYIISEWSPYSSLVQKEIKLNKKSKDEYYLEWKWFSGSNDNKVGSDVNSKYGLTLNVKAVEDND